MPHKNTLRSLVLRVPDALAGPRVGAMFTFAGNPLAGISDRDSDFCLSVALSEKVHHFWNHVADGIAITTLFDVSPS